MEQALKLVSDLRLDTEFLPEGVMHRRQILKPKSQPTQPSKPIKNRKSPYGHLLQTRPDSHLQVEDNLSVQINGESLDEIDEESATRIVESSIPQETVLIEIEEVWDIEPSSIIGQGAFGIVRFERRRPQMVNHTQTSENQVRAVKEIRKLNTPDYMKELQAIAKFSQGDVH
jgi:hypothetical protein